MAAEPTATSAPRVTWLDGIRGAAAVFVVLHHMWLAMWPGYPRNVGPSWLGWLLYGHLAVAVFIVVSGFSLALAPLRHGGALQGGMGRFIRRRAWRILPPYWAALILSVVVMAAAVDPATFDGPTIARSVAVHGTLLQDVVGSQTPNGAFWSIAVEWQIYFLFPLVLLLGRRFGMATSAVAACAVVVLAHFVAQLGGPAGQARRPDPAVLRPVRPGRAGRGSRCASAGHQPPAPACRRRRRRPRRLRGARGDPGVGLDGRELLLDRPALRGRRGLPAGACWPAAAPASRSARSGQGSVGASAPSRTASTSSTHRCWR